MNIYSYRFSALLLLSIILGGITGYYWGPHAVVLKPLGEIFLHLMYTIIVPLVFFCVSSAIINIDGLRRFRKILLNMLMVFFITGTIAAVFMIIGVILFPPTQHVVIPFTHSVAIQSVNMGDAIANMLMAPTLLQLFAPRNMLALIIFSVLVGLATAMVGDKGKPFAQFLRSGSDIFLMMITFVMMYAPIGFFAFFAALIGKLGPSLFHAYFRATILYYAGAALYLVLGFSFYAYLSGGKSLLKIFWKKSLPPAATALATCSSAASIPINLQATLNMNMPRDIVETIIPLGTIINKQGSVLGGVIKIAFLYGLFHMNFLTPFALGSTWIVAILVGTVMGAIPSGGMLGEILILSVYGFPPSALFIIATISIIIDPLATLLNVMGNTVSVLLIARLMKIKNIFQRDSVPLEVQ